MPTVGAAEKAAARVIVAAKAVLGSTEPTPKPHQDALDPRTDHAPAKTARNPRLTARRDHRAQTHPVAEPAGGARSTGARDGVDALKSAGELDRSRDRQLRPIHLSDEAVVAEDVVLLERAKITVHPP